MAVGFAVGVEKASKLLLNVSDNGRAATRTMERVAEMRRGTERERGGVVSVDAEGVVRDHWKLWWNLQGVLTESSGEGERERLLDLLPDFVVLVRPLIASSSP